MIINWNSPIHKSAHLGGGVGAGRLATAAAALSAGLGSCNHLTCVAGPYLMQRVRTIQLMLEYCTYG